MKTLTLALVLIGLSIGCTQPEGEKPNIVIIMADDLGYGDISSFGGWIDTPHLDQLAEEGMRFTNFYASGPVCSPTRAGLLTGRYQQRAGIPGVVYAAPNRNRQHGLQMNEVTLAEALREVGYATGMFGKWHLGYERRYNPIHQGFDIYRGYVSGNVDFFAHVDQAGFYDWWDGDQLINEPGYVTHLITKHAVQFIKDHQEEPFLLYMPHEAPHYPYQGSQDEPFRVVGKNTPEAREPEQVRRAYIEMVQEMDKGIGQMMHTLDSLGIRDNTIVFFFSDNGAAQAGSNGDLRGYKGSLWEGGIRVPAIANWPDHIPPASTTDQTAMTIDIMPTALALAGASSSKPFDGVDLSPVILNNTLLEDRALFWHYNNQVALRSGQWKYVEGLNGLEGPGLYNLSKDIAEQNNLVESQPEKLSELKSMFTQWQKDVTHNATEQPEGPVEIR